MHKDKRGMIKDLLTGVDIDAVTYVTFNKDAVRGNHVHYQTSQYDYVLEGRLRMRTDTENRVVKKGELIMHPKGVAHAYKALEDSVLISMTKGPRQGEKYEEDTYRLSAKDKLL